MKLSKEEEHLVLRDDYGRLFWSCHLGDLEESEHDCYDIHFTGVIREKKPNGEYRETVI